MPFTGTDEIHMRAPTCKYADSKSGFNDMVGIEIRYRQGNLAVFFYFGWRRHSRIVSLPHGESVRRHSPSFPWKEVPRRGGVCKRTGFLGANRRENPVRYHFEQSEMLASRSGLITHCAGQPRLAALGCPFQRKGLAGRASGKSCTSIALYKTHGASKFDAPYLHS